MRSHFIFFHHLPLTIGHMLKIMTLVLIINTVSKTINHERDDDGLDAFP